jgi:hypothetical protein
MLGKRHTTNYGNSGFPSWLVFLLGVASVFGLYYMVSGARNFIAVGGGDALQATERAVIAETATIEQIEYVQSQFTPRATMTPLPECQDFEVIVLSAIVREGPSTASDILESLPRGEPVCVVGMLNDEWYVIDRRPITRRIETAYMFYNIIEAINPTPTPSDTFTPAPTVTDMPTNTATLTPIPLPTVTPDFDATRTPTPTPIPSPTTAVQGI